MPLRLWEFLIGFGVSKLILQSGLTPKKYSWVGTIGLLTIIYVCIFVSVDGDSLSRIYGHPSVSALIVCLSTALVLAFGLPNKFENNLISALLIKIGKYSYSIYLVHFPLIVIYLYKPFSGTILHSTLTDKAILLTLIGISSYLLFNLIEKTKISFIKCYCVALISVISIIFISPIINKYLYNQEQIKIFNALEDRATYRCGKLFRITHHHDITCKINNQNFSKNIVLLGNSHADSIKISFSKVASKFGYNTYFFVDNNPMMQENIPASMVIKEAIDKKAQYIFVHYANHSLDLGQFNDLIKLANENGINVVLIKPVPQYKDSVPKLLFLKEIPQTNLKDYKNSTLDLDADLGRLLNYKNLSVYEVAPSFCHPNCQLMSTDHKPYYFDSGHLTLTGAETLEPVFSAAFSNINR